MRSKELLIALLLLIVSFCFAGAFAEDADIPEFGATIQYEEGYHHYEASRDDVAPIQIVSLVLSDGKLVTGEEASWTLNATGGLPPYTYTFALYRQEISDSSNTFKYVKNSSKKNLSSNLYRFAIASDGRYVLQFSVTDSAGNALTVQSSTRQTASTTVRNKVKSVVAACIKPDMTEYQKALALHDWLCKNATYDYQHTLGTNDYQADGVLLYGKGVCQSFSLAYQMLLKEVGIESMMVRGNANGGYHGWNLVKMDGEWYHVDVTWDEPNNSHHYFGMTTTMIQRDHTITDPIVDVLAAKNCYYSQSVDGGFSTFEELEALILAIPPGEHPFKFFYAGKGVIGSEYANWLNENRDTLFVSKPNQVLWGDSKNTMYVTGVRNAPYLFVTIPSKIEFIEANSFENVTSLKIVRFGENSQCRSIGDAAFKNCVQLTEIHIPVSLTEFGTDVFSGCDPDKLKLFIASGNNAAILYAKANGLKYQTE